MKINKKNKLKVIHNKLQNKYKHTKANVLLIFRGVVISNFGSRFFSKNFVYKIFSKIIFDFLDGVNQVLLVQFCVFVFIRSFVNDINYFRSIMIPILYNKNDLAKTKRPNYQYHERRKALFKNYIKTQYNILSDIKNSIKQSGINSFFFNLPDMKKNYLEAQKMQTLLSSKYLKNNLKYQNIIGKITGRIMIFFGIESTKLKASFNKLFYTTFSLMVYKKTLLERRKKWKKIAYRALSLRRKFFRQRRVLKRISSRLMSSLTFYDK
jgi:hypothetical protein